MSGLTWPLVALRDLGTWYGGGTPSKSRPEFWTDGTIPWLSPKDMGNDTLMGTQDAITSAAVAGSSVRRVPPGSVALVVRSGILERTLPIAFVPFETTLNQDMKALVPADHVDPRWVARGLRSKEQEVLRECRKSGTTVASIETARLMDLTLPVPPIEEQRRILDTLEDHLSRLEAADHQVEDVRKRLSTLYGSALRRGLSSFGPSSYRWLPDVAQIVNGHTPKGLSDVARPGPIGDAIPFFKVGDMNGADGQVMRVARSYLSRVDAASLGVRLAPEGTVVFPKRGGAIATNKKRTLGVQGAFDLNTMGVAPSASLSPGYLLAWFEQIDLASLSDGSNVPQINTPDIARLQIPVPSLEEQEHLVVVLAALRSATEGLPLESIQKRSSSLRRSLLSSAFSGRLSGRGHPSDLIEELARV